MENAESKAELLAIVRRLGGEAEEDARESDFSDLRDAHWPIADEAWRRSDVSEALAGWLDNDAAAVRRGAAIALGHVAPCVLLGEVTRRLVANRERAGDYAPGVQEAVWSLSDYYAGDYCPGFLTSLVVDPLGPQEECERLAGLCDPVIEFYRAEKCGQDLAALLASLTAAKTV